MASHLNLNVGAWRGLDLVEPVEQGVRNEVWSGRLHGRRVSVRRTRRSFASLEWELALIDYLNTIGFRVPRVVRTKRGAMHFEGVVVQEWMEGHAPRSASDWDMAVDYLKRLHEATRDYPQRPECCAATQLVDCRRSIDVDIDQMPASAREKVLAVLAGIDGLPTSVVHGDPGAPNIRISETGDVGFLDWDESRYDVSYLDVVGLGVQVLDNETHWLATRAHHAWEAANGWIAEPDYARRQLQLLDGLS